MHKIVPHTTPSLALAQGLAPVAAAVVTTAQGRLVVLVVMAPVAALAMAHGRLVLAAVAQGRLVLAAAMAQRPSTTQISSDWDHYRDAYSCSALSSNLISSCANRFCN